MSFFLLIVVGGILTYAGVMIYLANQIDFEHSRLKLATAVPRSSPERERPNVQKMDTWLRWLQYGLVSVIFMMGFGVMQAAFLAGLSAEIPAMEGEIPEVSIGVALAAFLLALVVSVLGYQIITNPGIRLRIQVLLDRLGGAYNPDSRVHNITLLLMLAVLVSMVTMFVLSGGVSGIAESIQDGGTDTSDLVFQSVVQVAITLLGVGFAIRRDITQTLERLGLRLPTTSDVVWGVGFGIGFWLALLVVEVIWVSLTSPEMFEEQTAATEQLGQTLAALPLAIVFFNSVLIAVGEEIWMRGGLQPVFGIVVTSIFFTSLHIQVAFTPAMAIIFALSLGLGWLRRRQSTVAAIIAHFCFNFIQLALLSLAVQAV